MKITVEVDAYKVEMVKSAFADRFDRDMTDEEVEKFFIQTSQAGIGFALEQDEMLQLEFDELMK